MSRRSGKRGNVIEETPMENDVGVSEDRLPLAGVNIAGNIDAAKPIDGKRQPKKLSAALFLGENLPRPANHTTKVVREKVKEHEYVEVPVPVIDEAVGGLPVDLADINFAVNKDVPITKGGAKKSAKQKRVEDQQQIQEHIALPKVKGSGSGFALYAEDQIMSVRGEDEAPDATWDPDNLQQRDGRMGVLWQMWCELQEEERQEWTLRAIDHARLKHEWQAANKISRRGKQGGGAADAAGSGKPRKKPDGWSYVPIPKPKKRSGKAGEEWTTAAGKVRGWTEDDGGDQQQEEVEDLDPQAQEEAAAAPANAGKHGNRPDLWAKARQEATAKAEAAAEELEKVKKEAEDHGYKNVAAYQQHLKEQAKLKSRAAAHKKLLKKQQQEYLKAALPEKGIVPHKPGRKGNAAVRDDEADDEDMAEDDSAPAAAAVKKKSSKKRKGSAGMDDDDEGAGPSKRASGKATAKAPAKRSTATAKEVKQGSSRKRVETERAVAADDDDDDDVADDELAMEEEMEEASGSEVGSEDDDDDDLSDDDEEEEEEEEEQEDGGIIQQQNQASAPGVAAAGAAVAVAPKSGKLAKNQLAAVVPQLPAHNKGCGRGRKAAPAPQDDADQNVEQEQADIKQQQKVQQASSKSKKESTTLQDGMQQQPKQQPGSAKAVSGSGKARGQRGDSGKGVVLINQNGNDHLAQPARKDVAGRQQSGKRKADAAGGRAKAAAADVDKQANKKRRSGKGAHSAPAAEQSSGAGAKAGAASREGGGSRSQGRATAVQVEAELQPSKSEISPSKGGNGDDNDGAPVDGKGGSGTTGGGKRTTAPADDGRRTRRELVALGKELFSDTYNTKKRTRAATAAAAARQ
eukprot:jgi/Chrzof1/8276/Cz03g04060.t1